MEPIGRPGKPVRTDTLKKPELDFNKPTVFILGAGASFPYGLPLGSGLKKSMLLLENRHGTSSLQDFGVDIELTHKFFDTIKFSSFSTIDILLEKKTRFREIGAFCIALALLPLEVHDRLFPGHDWYPLFYDLLNLEGDNDLVSSISVVTLNYDRSLEHFLAKNIEYNCDDNLVKRSMQRLTGLSIVHAHGSLGPYPKIPYGSSRSPDSKQFLSAAKKAADKIKIVSDNLDESEDFMHAQQKIKEAENVVIIGFGYDPRTLELLFKDTDPSKKTVCGTACGLDESDREQVTEFFSGNIHFAPEDIIADKFVHLLVSGFDKERNTLKDS